MAMAQVIVVRRRVRNFHHPWWRQWISVSIVWFLTAMERHGEYLVKAYYCQDGSSCFIGWPD